MKTICFSSIKGGTGKSSLCILTANFAAAAGYRVLVADLDLQNSATSYYLDAPEPAERQNIAAALHTERLAENIVPTCREGVELLASSLDLVKLRAIGERTLERMLGRSRPSLRLPLYRHAAHLRQHHPERTPRLRPHHHPRRFHPIRPQGRALLPGTDQEGYRQAPRLAHPL